MLTRRAPQPAPIHPVARLARAALSNGRVWWFAAIALSLLLAWPLLIVDVPPLVDYPNHLARVFVLASLPGDPVLARFYTPHWSVIPNLALDLLAWPLLQVLPVHVGGRLLVACALLLPALGTFAYHAALNRQPHFWVLGVGFIAWNNCLLYGFLNFEIALGLALWLAAAWVRWRDGQPARAVLICAVGAPLLFACHLMGLVFLAALIAGAEANRIILHRAPMQAAARAVPALLIVFTAPAILYAVSSLQALGGDAQYQPLGAKLDQLLDVFANYSPALDRATASLLIAIPAAALLLRRGRVPGPAGWAALFLMAAFLASPSAWKGTFLLDTRFAVMLGFLLFAGFVPLGWPHGATRVVMAALLLLFTLRMAVLVTAWSAHRADLADLRAVLSLVRPGQSLYVVEAGFEEAPGYWALNPRWRRLSPGQRSDEHLAALALIEHRAWWPFLFDNPSQQPVETRPPYRQMAEAVGAMPHRHDVDAADLCGFDVVLVQEADAVPPLPSPRFRLLKQSGFAALYAVSSCRPAAGASLWLHRTGLSGPAAHRDLPPSERSGTSPGQANASTGRRG